MDNIFDDKLYVYDNYSTTIPNKICVYDLVKLKCHLRLLFSLISSFEINNSLLYSPLTSRFSIVLVEIDQTRDDRSMDIRLNRFWLHL